LPKENRTRLPPFWGSILGNTTGWM
jgi:hypothetical protein